MMAAASQPSPRRCEAPLGEQAGGDDPLNITSSSNGRLDSTTTTASQPELAELKASHQKLRETVRLRVHRAMEEETAAAATVKSFAGTSMATVAGWITAQTCYYAILRLIQFGADAKPELMSLLARVIYAVIATIAVPVVDWALKRRASQQSSHFLADQADLIRLCLPMFFAWAWKDVVSAAHVVVGEKFWTYLVVALVTTSLALAVEISPCYRRAVRAVKNGEGGTAWSRLPAMFSNVGLAVGFAWNAVIKFAPKQAIQRGEITAPIFVFMVVVVYYLVVTGAIICITARYTKSSSEEKADAEKAEAQRKHALKHKGCSYLENIEAQCADREPASNMQLMLSTASSIAGDIEKAGTNITIGTLHFVYAWAQLDTANALFFTYLVGCDGPAKCGYANNFYFALIVSIVFAKAAMMLKLAKRETKWDRASKALLTRALSLNTGWAWANYCKTAIDNSVVDGKLDALYLYIICTAFAWLVISCLHRRFEVERRAWDRHCKEEAETYELTLC